MSTLTTLLGLIKPDGSDIVNIDNINDNMDVLDAAVLLTASQTISNKTITAPNISTPTVTGGATIGGGLTVTSGGLTVSTSGLTVSAGGVTVTGNSTVTGTLGVSGTISRTGETIHLVGSGGGEPAFVNSWTNFDTSTYAPCGYTKRPDGTVYLQGLIKDGTVGASAFTLPSGYRPAKELHFTTPSNNAFAMIRVKADGEVWVQVGSNAWVSLAGVSFVLEPA